MIHDDYTNTGLEIVVNVFNAQVQTKLLFFI